MRPLVEEAFGSIDLDDVEDIGTKIKEATDALIDLEEVSDLEKTIATSFLEMSGPKQDVRPKLGFAATENIRLLRQIKLLIDDGERGAADASLGSANLIFLTLKTLELDNLIVKNQREIFCWRSKKQKHICIRICSALFMTICLKNHRRLSQIGNPPRK